MFLVKKQKEALGALRWYRREGEGEEARSNPNFVAIPTKWVKKICLKQRFKVSDVVIIIIRSLLLEELHGMESKLAGSSLSLSQVMISLSIVLP